MLRRWGLHPHYLWHWRWAFIRVQLFDSWCGCCGNTQGNRMPCGHSRSHSAQEVPGNRQQRLASSGAVKMILRSLLLTSSRMQLCSCTCACVLHLHVLQTQSLTLCVACTVLSCHATCHASQSCRNSTAQRFSTVKCSTWQRPEAGFLNKHKFYVGLKLAWSPQCFLHEFYPNLTINLAAQLAQNSCVVGVFAKWLCFGRCRQILPSSGSPGRRC